MGKIAYIKMQNIKEFWKKIQVCLSFIKNIAVNNILNNFFIERFTKYPNNYRYYKTGSLSEWYHFETTRPNNMETLESKNKIRLKIINTNCEETDLEIEKTEQIKDLIKLY